MKSIFNRPQLQFSGTNNRIMWMNKKLTFIIDRPILMLLAPWLFYFAFDLALTLWYDLEFRGFAFANLTLMAGFASSCVFFFWLIPGVFLPKHRLVPIFISLILLLLIVSIKYHLMTLMGLHNSSSPGFVVTEIIRLFNFCVVTFTVWTFYALFNTVREKSQTDKKYKELEMAHESLQLSPHFILNLIGDIAGKSIHYSTVLFEDLKHYTTILRYGYLDSGGFNSLASEIDTVQSYLHCQRLRFGNSLSMNIEIDQNLLTRDEEYMPKMVLLTFVENIFKHGVIQDSLFPLSISAKWEEKDGQPTFYFQTQNLIKSEKSGLNGGFGLQTARRLLTHYFKEMSLVTYKEGSVYNLKLTISYASLDQTWPHRR